MFRLNARNCDISCSRACNALVLLDVRVARPRRADDPESRIRDLGNDINREDRAHQGRNDPPSSVRRHRTRI